METLRTALTDVGTQLVDFVVGFAPNALTAIVVVLMGVIVAKITERILRSALVNVKVDSLLERIGVTDLLTKFGMRQSPSHGAARLVYYVLVVLFVQAAAGAVGLVAVTDAIASFFSYLPNIVAAVLTLLLGNVVANLASTAITSSARESGIVYANSMGRAVATVIMFIVAIMAITQLGIDTAMIRTVVIACLAGSAGAFALSFGLGTREVTRNIVAGFYARKLFRVGEPIEVQNESGTLSAITPTQALLEQDGRTVAIANAQLLDHSVKQ